MSMEQGTIVKILSGLFAVQTESGETLDCIARGRFRKEGISLLTGDSVRFSRQGRKGVVEELLPRRNAFIRPPVANLDLLVVFAACVNPVTKPFLIDRICAIAGNQNVPVVLCINKTDLADGGELAAIYEQSGFRVLRTSAVTGEGIEALRELLKGKFSAFTGNSGVGKSSILNALDARLHLDVGEVSEKLGRGRHTTRHVEVYTLPDGARIADTPGFSSFDTERMDLVLKENLQYAFSDFAPYLGACRFPDCAHLAEPDCAVRQAVENGKIHPSRYESYVRLYEHAKDIKTWQLKEE